MIQSQMRSFFMVIAGEYYRQRIHIWCIFWSILVISASLRSHGASLEMSFFLFGLIPTNRIVQRIRLIPGCHNVAIYVNHGPPQVEITLPVRPHNIFFHFI